MYHTLQKKASVLFDFLISICYTFVIVYAKRLKGVTMAKRYNDKKNDDKMKKLIARNWIICAVSLGLAVICYFCIR